MIQRKGILRCSLRLPLDLSNSFRAVGAVHAVKRRVECLMLHTTALKFDSILGSTLAVRSLLRQI